MVLDDLEMDGLWGKKRAEDCGDNICYLVFMCSVWSGI